MNTIIHNADIKDMIVSTINEYGWESAKNLALSFWVTFCYATDTYPDTWNYDSRLVEIWEELSKLEDFEHWDDIKNFDDFNSFMCTHIV